MSDTTQTRGGFKLTINPIILQLPLPALFTIAGWGFIKALLEKEIQAWTHIPWYN